MMKVVEVVKEAEEAEVVGVFEGIEEAAGGTMLLIKEGSGVGDVEEVVVLENCLTGCEC